MINCIQIIDLTFTLRTGSITLRTIQYFRKNLTWDCENHLCFDVSFLLMYKYKENGSTMAKKAANRLYYKCAME